MYLIINCQIIVCIFVLFQNVYFHSSLNDTSIAAVIEIIALAQMEDGSMQKVSCGWGMFRMFKYEGEMKDFSSLTPAPTHR